MRGRRKSKVESIVVTSTVGIDPCVAGRISFAQGDSKVTRDDLADASQRNATAAIMNISRVIAPVHIILSLPCGEQKGTIRRVNYCNTIADTLHGLTKARLWNPRNLSALHKDVH